jgi:hypothetical protein
MCLLGALLYNQRKKKTPEQYEDESTPNMRPVGHQGHPQHGQEQQQQQQYQPPNGPAYGQPPQRQAYQNV